MENEKDKEIEKLIAKKRLEIDALRKILESINSKRDEGASKQTTIK
ncbi:MAG: hypothetical protein MI866_13155 [Bacteroidales bacterium]|nr:hypothetical protein [Bacteroidales bacterium]